MIWGPLFTLLLPGFSRQWALKPQLKTYWWTILSNSIWPTLKCPVKISGRLQFQPQALLSRTFASCVWQCLPPVTSSRIYSIFGKSSFRLRGPTLLHFGVEGLYFTPTLYSVYGQEVAYIIAPVLIQVHIYWTGIWGFSNQKNSGVSWFLHAPSSILLIMNHGEQKKPQLFDLLWPPQTLVRVHNGVVREHNTLVDGILETSLLSLLLGTH